MRITCPQCQFKGLIDTGPLAFETTVACVRCGTTFDALLFEGEIQTSLPSDDVEMSPAEVEMLAAQQAELDAAVDADMQELHSAFNVEDVLALPQPAEVNAQPVEQQATVLEAVPPLTFDKVETEATENDALSDDDQRMEEFAAVMEAQQVQSPDEMQMLEATSLSDETSFKLSQASVAASADYDRHNTGMRLMRISPLWLLVCGITFISVIFVSNQFAKPAEAEQHIAANYIVPDNKATNQALADPLPPAANQTTASVQDVSQVSAPAAAELKDEAEDVEGDDDAEEQDEPEPAPAPSIVPAVETKSDVAATASSSEGEKTGGLTIQIGSYNAIEQANERLARLQAAGFDARVVTVELPKRGTWYRVQAGRFSSREEATRYGNEMKAKAATDSFIVTEAQSK